ncbi:MAG: hypothetical protein MPK62_01825 [Alphaproteobacteria bacterium]|nr:hypothetical protein [Alphaproteobacteria bacterium]
MSRQCMVDPTKREAGRYYTERNPFVLRAFKKWARAYDIANDVILEPFAGKNNLIDMLDKLGYCRRFRSFDIKPADPDVDRRDTIASFPGGYRTCVSNPPWLGKYSCKRRGLPWPNIAYDDLYKHCLELALENCENVGFIIPATFLHWWSGLSRQYGLDDHLGKRLESVTFLNSKVFSDTDNPVCMALFGSKKQQDVSIYYDNNCVGTHDELKEHLPGEASERIRFNVKNGSLGLVGIDDTTGPTIRFCKGSEIASNVQHSSRSLTRIDYKMTSSQIADLNAKFQKFRKDTHDVFLTPFKGLRKDGRYRRRLDYGLAREILCKYAS